MKTITSFAFVLVIIASSAYGKPLLLSKNLVSNCTSKQLADVFETFHVHRQGDFASLNWNVSTEDVASFNIERSYDGTFFEPIATVAPDDARWNRFTDETVEPGIIYYRITAIMNDGSVECSATESVKIVKHK